MPPGGQHGQLVQETSIHDFWQIYEEMYNQIYPKDLLTTYYHWLEPTCTCISTSNDSEDLCTVWLNM